MREMFLVFAFALATVVASAIVIAERVEWPAALR